MWILELCNVDLLGKTSSPNFSTPRYLHGGPNIQIGLLGTCTPSWKRVYRTCVLFLWLNESEM